MELQTLYIGARFTANVARSDAICDWGDVFVFLAAIMQQLEYEKRYLSRCGRLFETPK